MDIRPSRPSLAKSAGPGPERTLGAFYVGDVPLPAGVHTPAVDVPMVLNDAGTIGLLNGKSFPATATACPSKETAAFPLLQLMVSVPFMPAASCPGTSQRMV